MSLPLLSKLQVWALVSGLPFTPFGSNNFRTLDILNTGKVYLGRSESGRVYELDVSKKLDNQKEWDLLPKNPYPALLPNITHLKTSLIKNITPTVWMNYSKKVPLVELEPDKNKVTYWKDLTGTLHIDHLAIGPSGFVWISNLDTIARFIPKSRKLTYWKLPKDFPSISAIWAGPNKNEVWLAFNEGLQVHKRVLFARFFAGKGTSNKRPLVTYSFYTGARRNMGTWGAATLSITGHQDLKTGLNIWVSQALSGYGAPLIFRYNVNSQELSFFPYSNWGEGVGGSGVDRKGNFWSISSLKFIVGTEANKSCSKAKFSQNIYNLQTKSLNLIPEKVTLTPQLATASRRDIITNSATNNGCFTGYQIPSTAMSHNVNIDTFEVGHFPISSSKNFGLFFLENNTPHLFLYY